LNSIPRREAIAGNNGGKNKGKGEEEIQAAREDHDGKTKGSYWWWEQRQGEFVEGPEFI